MTKMFEQSIMLSNFKKVKDFVDIANKMSYDVELVSGKTHVNAKSIIGVFSLDLTKPVVVVAHTDAPAELALQIKKFSV